MATQYYARKKEDGETIQYQTLLDHLTQTAEYAATYAQTFTSREIGYTLGLLHDIGKYSDRFQQRLEDNTIRTDHATAGAQVAAEIAKSLPCPEKITYYLLSYIIAGHHGSGIPNWINTNNDRKNDLETRIKNADPKLYNAWKTELPQTFPSLADCITREKIRADTYEEIGLSLFLYTRFLHSCLIDADRTDAATAFGEQLPGTEYLPLTEMEQLLDDYINREYTNKTGEINQLRTAIRHQCTKAAIQKPGIFTLTVPTGGGKTISSLAFALKHANQHQCDRIIYTIPFTSIIEQNAGIYKKIFGRDNVLEHHSNFTLPSSLRTNTLDDSDPKNLKLAMAAETWNAPLILTTNVQFFESLFSSRPSPSRKVHNIANSVIILDEVQALPPAYLKPCMYALAELVKNYHCSVVLCTATQPDFRKSNILPNIPVTPIITNYPELADKMQRVRCHFLKEQTLDQIAEQLKNRKQVLCIVNTKQHAADLYKKITKTGDCFHLSTNMCPAHRKKVLDEIRRRLKPDVNLPCRVVSTQLIEAGVDIDFPVVYRSLAGVDSITQAAGRCNREGNLPYGDLYVFIPESTYAGPDYIKTTADITRSISENYLTPEAIRKYFSLLFDIKQNRLDKLQILNLCKNAAQTPHFPFPFRYISDEFHLIADAGYSVIIPCSPYVQKRITRLDKGETGQILRELTPYTISVTLKDLDYLHTCGAVRLAGGSFAVLTDLKYYDQAIGLNWDGVPSDFDYVLP
ncbi:CRISPR-associated helicase Cas3' [Methanocorpusculum vombati]|uniref:CRISPR-associated helicase Cas3 n=1 Tax=Methanocorpusculum vombati TaxID=3002864 RepID=A0ABT4IM88_9EURY|nr:CRISPR-associated helicase Cas3' [Methanocorpusculum vombati]MCZ0862459.1 CRISPR-associated helicase Cas3' [Methanocorpusculum vombati]MCZ9320207.1 CRISPR-associated helicase Cas3' [Methanocorpusculum sp.]MDE2521134.1 CRISPR-associated helicase Cas3' [Methanocorpusculum sp.]MDE2546886.1 CRISPR-associated helicase Cas3' [Methanocorpusculum sp.]